MAYVRPGNGIIFQNDAKIGLSVNIPNSIFQGNIFMFPLEKMTINGSQVTLKDYNGEIFSISDVNFRHTESRIKEYYKTYPDNYVAYYYMSIYNKQSGHLSTAIQWLEKTEKNRFQDEIRQLRARIDSGNLEAKVGNYPNPSIFDSKANNDKVRTARIEIDRYNETTYNFGVFSRIIETRNIDPKRFENFTPSAEDWANEIDQEAINQLIKTLEQEQGAKRKTYWIVGVLLLAFIIIRRRNNHN